MFFPTRKFALVPLFKKHPELVTQHKNSEIADIVSHASTKTLDANIVNKAYNNIKITVKKKCRVRS